ncbi:MAG: hypothetical protein Tsb0020_14750 [Haliangiales bacterium]
MSTTSANCGRARRASVSAPRAGSLHLVALAPRLSRAGLCVAGLALALAGCNPRPPAEAAPRASVVEPAEEPPPPPVDLVQITVLSAEIQGRMANGQHWDDDDDEPSGTGAKLFERYLEYHPELFGYTDWVGIPITDPELPEQAEDSEAADPMVLIELDGAVARSPVIPRSFTPVWDFAYRFLYGQLGERVGVPRGSLARIHVVDYDGPGDFEAVGTTVIPIDELLAAQVHEIGPFGAVAKLILQVDVIPPPAAPDARTSTRLAVPGTAPWTDTGIDIQAGQRVLIRAADEVCTGSSMPYCSGPEGQREPDTRNNLPGFLALGHGALVGAIGDTRFAVLRQREFIAPAGGRLMLGVNDESVGNNRGAYAVHVEVYEVP